MRSIIIVTSTLFVTSAFAQQASQGSALIPDLSGTWSHPYIPRFEPPLSGSGPVINKFRRKQVFDIDGRLIAPGTDPPLASNTFRYVGDYTNSILKPWAAETVRKYGEVESSGLAQC
jgi:hypothetical protein